MKQILALTLVLACFLVSPISFGQPTDPPKLRDDEWYRDCAASAAREKVSGERQFVQLLNVCYDKAVPKKCRDVSEHEYPPDYQPKTIQERHFGRTARGSLKELCVIECFQAGYYSRTFGECSKG